MPNMSRELIMQMLMDDRESMGSDEDYGSLHENEMALMLEPGRFELD